MADRLARAADVEDYTWFWWKLRPHPGWERSRSGRSTPRLAARRRRHRRAHALLGSECREQTPRHVAPELIEEGIFRAARFGTAARLPDADGALRPVEELLAER